jgi:hypothetical protein
MDINILLANFSATLQNDLSNRHEGELKLREMSSVPGFLAACLDVIGHPDPSIPTGVRKAAALFFKNRIIKYWGRSEGAESQGIDPDERPIIKERILSVIIHSDYTTKQQLMPVLRLLISHDFSKWPGLLDVTGKLLQIPADDSEESTSQLYTGLLCFSEICRKFRWVDNLERKFELYPIIESGFPHLLEIGKSLCHKDLTEVSAEMLKLILKVYKFVTYFDLPEPLQTRESMMAWIAFHISIINMKPPAYISTSTSEKDKNLKQVSKCYKWSVANMYRIFTRYSSKNLSKKYKYDAFYDMFLGEFIPPIVDNYLQLINAWCVGEKWLSSSSLYYIIEFFSHCVVEKSTWTLLKPYYETLISHLIYPLLCPSNDVLELFETDPHEYIQLNFDIIDEFDSPDIAALGLLVTFVYKKKTTLEPIMTFINNQLSELQEDTAQNAVKKDGLLRMLGGISGYLNSYENEMEAFLIKLVYPNLTSKFEFLKARTFDIVSKFADFPLTQKSVVFEGILTNFNDENVSLPVGFECALAIQSFIHDEDFKNILSEIIIPTMSKLLDISNEIDNDAISIVMQECVENFSLQLQPFGIDLMSKLVEQFMKLAVEINENDEDISDKVMAAIGLINTMITILLSFENSLEICIKLEEVFSPIIEYVLVHKLDDFLAEIGELIENSTFLLRSITPTMWKNFQLLYDAFENGIAIMYLEELIQCLQNFLNYGKHDLIEHPELAEKFFKIFQIIASDVNQVGINDLIYGCELAQTFILCLGYKAVAYIPEFVKSVLQMNESPNNALTININNVLVSSVIYDAPTTLSTLQEFQQFQAFFETWFKLVPQLKRCYDIKLSILGLISLISNEEIVKRLDLNLVQLFGRMLMLLMKELPISIETLKKKRKNFNELDQFKPEEDIDETGEYLNFLQEEDLKLKNSGYFDEDELVIEDPLATTALDSVDVGRVFEEFMESLLGEVRDVVFGKL